MAICNNIICYESCSRFEQFRLDGKPQWVECHNKIGIACFTEMAKSEWVNKRREEKKCKSWKATWIHWSIGIMINWCVSNSENKSKLWQKGKSHEVSDGHSHTAWIMFINWYDDIANSTIATLLNRLNSNRYSEKTTAEFFYPFCSISFHWPNSFAWLKL